MCLSNPSLLKVTHSRHTLKLYTSYSALTVLCVCFFTAAEWVVLENHNYVMESFSLFFFFFFQSHQYIDGYENQ